MLIGFLRAAPLAFVLTLVACSDADSGPNVTMTIETITGDSLTAQYRVGCRGSAPEFLEEGSFEPFGMSMSDDIIGFGQVVDTILWTASFSAPAGECAVDYRLRDREAEVLCSGQQEFVVPADAPKEVYYLLVCELF